MSDENGWQNYSNLVLQQLETLSKGIEGLRDDLQTVKNHMARIEANEDRLNEVRAWKEKIDEVASPSQLKDALVKLEDLKEFKTKAVTIFMVVQFAMAAAMFVRELM